MQKTGGVYTVTLIPGDGIGHEIAGSVKEVFESLNVPVEWEQFNVSGETHGSESLFKEAMESLRRNKVGLKGAFRRFPSAYFYCCKVAIQNSHPPRLP